MDTPISDYSTCVARMLNTRSTTWDPLPEYVDLFRYSINLNLLPADKELIKIMLEEYYDGLHRYKPAPWAITAERIRLIHKIGSRLKHPAPADIRKVIYEVTKLTASQTPYLKEAVRLLQYLHDNMHKMSYNQSTITVDEDSEF